jgi:serine/threonine-protein kinase HipA
VATLRYAVVTFKEQRAGLLREEPDGGTSFLYDAQYLTTDLPAVGLSLPKQPDALRWPHGLHPFFEHLAPEGWLRRRQAQAAHLDEQDDFGLLLAYGRDCIGAVSVVDPAAAPPAGRSDGLDRETVAAIAGQRTISGVQRKLLVVEEDGRFLPAGPTGPAPFIAKLPERDPEYLVENELLTLRACAALLGPTEVPTIRRGKVEGFEDLALIVKRFDRTDANEKLRLEDFAQILSKPRGRDYAGKYDAGYEQCADVIRRHSARAVLDLARFIKRLVVFAVLGNTDAHLKNFSLLETSSGLRLSPCYDVVNTYLYARQGYSGTFALTIAGEKLPLERLTGGVLTDLARKIGLPETAIAWALADIRSRRDRLFQLIDRTHGLPDEIREPYSDIVSAGWSRVFAT